MQLRSQYQRTSSGLWLLEAVPAVEAIVNRSCMPRAHLFRATGPAVRVRPGTWRQPGVIPWAVRGRGILPFRCMAYFHRAKLLVAAGTASSGSTAWAPTDIGLNAYWQADLGHAVSDASTISSHANQGTAGTSADIGQGTAAFQYTFDEVHASFNNASVIDCDGGDVLYAAAGDWWELASESSDATIFCLERQTTEASTETLVRTVAWSTGGGFQVRPRTNGAIRCDAYEQGAGAVVSDSGSDGSPNTVHAIALVLTGAVTTSSDTLLTWVDGANGSGGDAADLSSPVANATDREWLVGGTGTSSGQFLGQWAFIGFTKALVSSGDDTLLYGWCNTTYGTSLTGFTQ